MSLQTSLTTRRQFLERSMLGFGSAFLLPSLLQSCMQDHVIPPPNPDTPSLGFEINWNDDAKILVTSALEMLPVGGDILGPLVDIFWPSPQEDVWGEIRAQVEALIDQKIADSVYQDVSNDLGTLNSDGKSGSGLVGALVLYLNEMNNGTASEVLTQWQITRTAFVNALAHFQSKAEPKYQLHLLPLFAQFANMYLGLLRDIVCFGAYWGRTYADQQQDYNDLQQAISDYRAYTLNVYSTGRANLANNTKKDNHNCEPFRTLNNFDRQMSQIVLYFYDLWPYYDVLKYPPLVTKNVYPREIFSDPYGRCDNSGDIYPLLQKTPGTQLPVGITVKAWDRIQSVGVTYPANSGPDGLTTTYRGADGGDTHTITIAPNNPIAAARAGAGDIVNALQFQYADGTTTDQIASGGGDSGWIGYPNMALSSVHINGVSDFYKCADCVVFGFQSWTPPSATLNAIQAMYVKVPKERSAADFAKAFPKATISAGLITDELKAKRKAYWEALEARAKALK